MAAMKKRITLRYADDIPGYSLMRRIEKLALADRRSLGCRFGEPCDPRQLVQFHDVSRILETFEDYKSLFGRVLQGEFEERWSGVTLHIQNGEHLILINPNHGLARRNFTIAHEFGHLVFSHQPISIAAEGMLQLRYSDEQEFEAHGYGLAVLLPYAPLLQMIRQGASIVGIANHYGVSAAAVEMRLKTTGLWEYTTWRVMK